MAWKRGYNKKGKKSMPKSAGAGAVKQARPKAKTMGYVNINKLAMAVSKIGINKQEKKRYHLYQTDQTVGQLKVSGTSFVSGHYNADISPTPSNGSGVSDMIGNKIRLMSSRLHFQFRQQANTFGGPIKGTIYVIQPNGKLGDVPQIPGEFLNANPYLAVQGVTVYDNISNRNFDTMKNFIVHRKIPFVFREDSTGTGAQVIVKTFNFGIKYNKGKGISMSFANGIPLTDEITLLVVLDYGNASNTVGSVIPSGVPISGAATGLIMTYFVDHWYTDN